MKNCLLVVLLLAIVSNALGTYFSPRTSLKPHVIEIMKWRQPVCAILGKDVVPCFSSQEQIQEYQHSSAERPNEDEPDQMKPIIKVETSYPTDVVGPSEPSELVIKEELADSGRTPELLSKTSEIGAKWQFKEHSIIRNEPDDSESTGSTRKRILRKIYVTKVSYLPMSTTLITRGCLYNINLPLCEDYQLEKEDNRRQRRSSTIEMHEQTFLKDPLDSKTILFNEENHSLKVTDKPKSYIDHKLEINITKPTKNYKREINITKNRKQSFLPFYLKSTFEKLNKFRNPLKAEAFLNFLRNERTTIRFKSLQMPLVDLLLPEGFNISDKFQKKEKYSEDSCDKARKTSVLQFQFSIIKNSNYSNIIDEVEACLQDLEYHIKQSKKNIKQKSPTQSTKSNHKIGTMARTRC